VQVSRRGMGVCSAAWPGWQDATCEQGRATTTHTAAFWLGALAWLCHVGTECNTTSEQAITCSEKLHDLNPLCATGTLGLLRQPQAAGSIPFHELQSWRLDRRAAAGCRCWCCTCAQPCMQHTAARHNTIFVPPRCSVCDRPLCLCVVMVERQPGACAQRGGTRLLPLGAVWSLVTPPGVHIVCGCECVYMPPAAGCVGRVFL
jgi:hypothetical protein